jgi:tetratricopeptide (TPR) repeat protein
MADVAMDGFARAVWDSGDDDGSLRAVMGIIRDEVGFAQDTFDSGMSMLEEMDGGGWPEGMGDAGDGGDSPGAVTSRILYGGALEDEIEAWAMARATEDPGGGSRGDGSRQAQGELPAAGRPDGSPSGAERTSDVASGTQLSRAGASGTAGGHAAASAGRPGGTDFGSRPSGALRGELRRIRVRRGNGHEDTLEAECRLAEALAGEGSHAGALRHLRRAMEGFMRLQGPEGPGTLRVKRLLPDALLLAGEAAEAASMLREELREVREGAGEGSPEELRAMSRLGGALARTGVDGAEAGDLLGRPARLLGDLLGPGHPAVLAARALWTDFLTGSLDPGLGLERALEPADPARKIDLEEVLRFCGTQAAGPGDGAGGNFGGTPDPARVYGERTRKASVLHALGRHGEARAVLEEMLGEAGRTLGPRHPFVLSAMCASAGALAGLDPQASVAEHDRVLQARMELSGDGHPDTAGSYAHLGRALLAAGDPDGALAAWVYAFRALEALGGPYLADAAAIRMRTGRIFMEGGDPDLAFRQYGRAGALWSDLRGPGCPGALEAMEQEARALLACGRAGDGAAVLCRAAFERDAAARPEGRPGSGNGRGAESPGNPGGPESSASRRETAGMLARLAETVLVCGGEPREARAVVAHELELWEAVSGEGSPEALDALYRLARAWEACGCREEARELHGKALQGREKALGSGHPDTEKSRAAFEELEGGR